MPRLCLCDEVTPHKVAVPPPSASTSRSGASAGRRSAGGEAACRTAPPRGRGASCGARCTAACCSRRCTRSSPARCRTAGSRRRRWGTLRRRRRTYGNVSLKKQRKQRHLNDGPTERPTSRLLRVTGVCRRGVRPNNLYARMKTGKLIFRSAATCVIAPRGLLHPDASASPLIGLFILHLLQIQKLHLWSSGPRLQVNTITSALPLNNVAVTSEEDELSDERFNQSGVDSPSGFTSTSFWHMSCTLTVQLTT